MPLRIELPEDLEKSLAGWIQAYKLDSILQVYSIKYSGSAESIIDLIPRFTALKIQAKVDHVVSIKAGIKVDYNYHVRRQQFYNDCTATLEMISFIMMMIDSVREDASAVEKVLDSRPQLADSMNNIRDCKELCML